MTRWIILALLLWSGAASAACSGTAGVPFNCTAGISPALTDAFLAGSNSGTQAGKTVQYTGAQIVGLDHSLSPITANGVTQTAAGWVGYLSGTLNPNPLYMGGTAYMGPWAWNTSPALIGQGLTTDIYALFNPTPPAGRTNQYIGLGVELSAGASISEAAVSFWSWAQTGSGGAPIWGGNIGVQWNAGTPDVSLHGLEVDINNNASDTFTGYKDALEIQSGGSHHAGIGLYIGASNPGTNDFLTGALIHASQYGIRINADAPPMTGGLILQQYADGTNGIVLQRKTDTAPTGNLISILNAANTVSLFNVDVNGTVYLGGSLITKTSTPASSSAACTQGQIEFDASYVYTCVATNTWRRAATSSF